MLPTIVTFLAICFSVLAGCALISDLFLRYRLRMRERFEQEFPALRQESEPIFRDLDSLEELSAADAAAPVLSEPPPSWRASWNRKLATLGWPVSFEGLLGLSAALSVTLGLVCGIVLTPTLALVGLALGALLPLLCLSWRYHLRLEKLREQLPEAFDLMARVLRAGHSVPQALHAVVEEFDDPLRSEMAYAEEQQQLGLLPELSFRELARRTEVMELKIFVMALLIQRQTGGNLSDLLERLATLVRDRVRIRGKIRTLTAEGRLQALVLLILPPLMFVVLYFVKPDYVQELYQRQHLMLATLLLMAVGAARIRRIIHFEI